MRKTMRSAALSALLLATPLIVLADQKPRDLAMESYRFMEARQDRLTTFIKEADKSDYFTQFSSPAKIIVAKWPQPLTEDYYDYANCYFALDLLIKYGDRAIADKSQKDPALVARKARFSNAYRECQRDLRKTP